jgi:ornithine decarboxylase
VLMCRLVSVCALQARCPLGLKYGCDPAEAQKLLKTAADLGLEVMGVSFHVGSGCK